MGLVRADATQAANQSADAARALAVSEHLLEQAQQEAEHAAATSARAGERARAAEAAAAACAHGLKEAGADVEAAQAAQAALGAQAAERDAAQRKARLKLGELSLGLGREP